MQRISFFCFSMIFAVKSFALYNGNPSLPGMPENPIFQSNNSFISIKSGYEGDFLFGRKISVSGGASSPGMHSMFNAASLALGFVNQVELYTVLGAVKTTVAVDANGPNIKLHTSENFGGDVGIRVNTSVWGDMKFGVDAKYFYAWPSLESIKVRGNSVSKSGKVFQKEWQVGASLSQSFAFFTPYAGIKFAKFSMDFIDLVGLEPWLSSEEVHIDNKSPFGCFVGLGIAGNTGYYLNFEARFVDEYAVTGAAGLSF